MGIKYKAKYSGKIYNTEREAIDDNTSFLKAKRAAIEKEEKGKFYIVQKGDTLSSISKKYSGKGSNYGNIAKFNKIANADIIHPGQRIAIPEKFDKPLKFKDIPTKNRVSVIDDYSPNYNYIVEGDKIYYSKKGNDYWVDISDNDVARKNLHNHIETKYNYKGYEDNERDIGDKIKNNKYNYKEAINRGTVKKRFLDETPLPSDTFVPSSLYVNRNEFVSKDKPIYKENFLEKGYNFIRDTYQKGVNYLHRQAEKNFGGNEDITNLSLPQYKDINSAYGIIPQSYTGDTINVKGNRNQYIIPESIDLNGVKLGVRNRGSREPINTEGAIITNFNGYSPYSKIDKKDKQSTYMGIDKNGNFKVGNIDSFSEGDVLTKTYANDIESFAKDASGKQLYKNDAVHGNRRRNVPIVNVLDSKGNKIQGSINVLSDLNDYNGTYGNITGGRVILEAGNERRLVSGSISDIEKQFNDLKKRHGVKSVRAYTLDNGSYNRGLRTRNRLLSKNDLIQYDNQNSGGGNFMYLKDVPGFSTDTILTPNIRTKSSESYVKGHPLKNEKKGVVLHHTGFMDSDLGSVTKHLTNPNSEASSHLIIGYNGHRRILANPDDVTFHAGQSVWNNRDNVNDFMLGVEFQGDTNKKDLTPEQINSAVEYLTPIIRSNGIPLENIVTHQQVRDKYNQLARKQGLSMAASKPDINQRNYLRVMDVLKNRLYYKK